MTNQAFWEDLKSGKITAMIKEAAPEHTVSNSDETYNIMKPIFAQEDDVEKMYGVFVNGQNNILAIDLLAAGSIGQSSVYPREIVKKVIKNKAASLIVAHNHPSGNPYPSSEDRLITQSIMIAVKSIGVSLLDHIIIGRETYFSFADENVLKQIKNTIRPLFKL